MVGSGQFAQPELRARTECVFAEGALAYDADSDGNNDLLVLGSYDRIWLYHGDGTGNMGRGEVVGTFNTLPDLPRFLDIDLDGDPDLAGIWSGGGSLKDTLAWCENDGTGHFGAKHFAAAPLQHIDAFELADMDNDGDLDAILYSDYEDALAWCANDGNMGFGPLQSILQQSGIWSWTIGDLDADGDNDIAHRFPGTGGHQWLRNDGTGSFTVAQSFPGQETRWLMAEDVDEDGDTDLLASYASSGLFQFTNDGSGELAASIQIGPVGDLDGLLDINQDGIRDGWYQNNYQNATAGYCPGDGSGQFGAIVPLFTYTSMTMNFLAWGDLNDDGALDMISMFSDDGVDELWWRANDGTGSFPTYETPISRGMDDPRSFVAGDMDGDGDEDLVAVMRSNLKISWLENDGTGQWAEHPIRSWPVGWTAGEQVNTGDADGDGDLDVLITTHDGLYTGSAYWNLNDGAGQFTDGPGFVGHGTGNGHFRSIQADLNEDGLMDLIAFKDSVYYWENIPGSPFHYAVGLTTSGEPGEWGFNTGDLGDVDEDGDVDIVVRGLSLLENAGDMTFSAPQTIVEEDSGPVVRLADMDGDGDPDIVAQAGNPRAVVWWENDGGYFIERHAITGTRGTDNEFVFLVEDFDTDGDMDIAAPLESGAPVYFMNHGDGTFSAPVLLREPGGMCSALCSGDFNGDGLRDLAMGLDGNSIWTAAGYGGSPYQLSGNIYIDEDGDGIRDPGEVPLQGAQLLLDPPIGAASVNADGLFTAHVAAGTYTVTAVAPSADWQPTAPVSHTITVNSGSPTATGLDLGYWDPTPQDDLIASITPSFLACAGHVPLWATVVNNGTTNVSASLRVGLDPLLGYVGAVPPPDAILGDTLVWNADTLHPFGSRTVAITVNMPGASFAGDPVHNGLRATGTSVVSGSPVGSVYSRTDTIVCGGESNVKTCEPPGQGIYHSIPFATPYLDYTILFQNTGSTNAHTVVVRDQLPAGLRAEEIIVMGSSHPYTIMVDQYWESLTEYRFTFIGIDLPPQSIDPLGSQGFISLRLPVDHANAGHGTYVSNYASIDFLSEEMTGFTSYADVVLTDCDLLQPGIYESAGSGQTSLNSTEGFDYYEHYTWYLNGEALPGTNWWNLWPDQSGLYTVEVTDQFGCVVMSEPYAWVMQGLGIPDPRGWRMFPNPATGDVRVVSSESVQGITLIDVTGRKVFEDRFLPRNEMVLERGALPSGLYHIVLYGAGSHRLGTDRVVFE